MDPDTIIGLLGLAPHPEGGHYVETWRAPAPAGDRGAGTAIYFLLRAGEVSHWHRVDAAEVWHFYAGDPLVLAIADIDPEAADEAGAVHEVVLGTDLAAGQRPQHVVPARAWQAARPLGAWTLAGCTVSPAFDVAGFELAPPGWTPTGRADAPEGGRP
jgi:predicted cupin superfamily sugar epimerase